MAQIEKITNGLFQTNTYVYSNKGKTFLIDPALSDTDFLSLARNMGLKLNAIIYTHNHIDHIGGFKKEFSALPIYMGKKDILNLTRENLEHDFDIYASHIFDKDSEKYNEFIELILGAKKNFIASDDNDEIEGIFTTLSTPGHTKGSISLLDKEEKILFSGDTLFHHGFGRYDLPFGDIDELRSSLIRLNSLDTSIKVYPGHGENSSILASQGLIQYL